MNTNMLAKLERAINKFINDTDEDRDFYIYDELGVDMTKAAAAVYDANKKGQEFAKEQ